MILSWDSEPVYADVCMAGSFLTVDTGDFTLLDNNQMADFKGTWKNYDRDDFLALMSPVHVWNIV